MKASTCLIVTFSLLLQIQFSNATPGRDRQSSEIEDSEEDELQRSIADDSDEEQPDRKLPPATLLPNVVQNFQAPERLHNICLEPKQIGKCQLFLPRYFFNSETAQCERFTYGGCGANGNNFPTLVDCEKRCANPKSALEQIDAAVSSAEDRDYVQPDICEMAPTVSGQNCKAYLPRWTFDSQQGRCVQFIYSGCGATDNMYLRKYDCQQQCGNYRPTTSEASVSTPASIVESQVTTSATSRICELPLDTGTCFSMIKRFYFNHESNRCLSFTFNGCGGNDNNFQTGEECLRTCGGSTPAENVACTHVSCPMNLYTHYTAVGCEPLFDGNACCPTRYDCQRKVTNQTEAERFEDREASRSPKCSYRGRLYSIGEEIREASSTSACRAGCTCSASGNGKARINCASIECPETLGVRPPGKENCTLLYRKSECCAYDYHCPKNSSSLLESDATWIQLPEEQVPLQVNEPFKCTYEGREYVEGERMQPKEDTCKTCICKAGFNGTLNADFCEPVDCGIEIYYADQMEKGCVPVYYQDAENRIRCCPIGWECPNENLQVPTRSPPMRPYGGNRSRSPYPPPNIPRPEVPELSEGTVSTDACSLPREVGPCKASRPRYAYNTLSRSCVPFSYGGCGGNKNNFVSLEDCTRVCGNSSQAFRPRNRNSPSISRSSNLTPQNFELTAVDACTQEPKLGPCRGYFRRFYYSPELDECRSFVYSGCGGNKNNFHTIESCAAYCQNKIPTEVGSDHATQVGVEISQSELNDSLARVNPRRSNVPVADIRNTEQPNGQQTISNEEICSLPQTKGPCRGFLQRFYFDTVSGSCERFTYGGCGGNDNNFLTVRECEASCLPTVTANPSHEAAQVQVTLAPKWRTLSVVPLAQLPERSTNKNSAEFFERCKLPKQVGPCRAHIPSFFFDIESRTCKPFNYGGCFGNTNRFSTAIECESICNQSESETRRSQPTEAPRRHLPDFRDSRTTPAIMEQNLGICSLPPASGSCRAYTVRFHWQSELKQCLPFVYSGCNGNGNNFPTESDCLSTCAQEPPIERIADAGVLTCSFGNETFPIGGVLGGERSGSTCGRPVCQCVTPPALTCIQRQCPTMPFLFQPQTTPATVQEEETARCRLVNCPGRCRSMLGQDGCPVCDCRTTPRVTPIPLPPIPSQRKQDGPCKMFKCAPYCRPGVDTMTGCPTCDCESTQRQVQESMMPQ